jgi:Glycosyltransferase 61
VPPETNTASSRAAEHSSIDSGVFAAPRTCSIRRPLAWTRRKQRHELFRVAAELESIAERSWVIYPSEIAVSRSAYSLPGQLERVTGMAYTNDPRLDMTGGIETLLPPTRGFLVKDAWLVDGSLHKRPKRFALHSRRRYLPPLRVDHELDRSAIYSTYEGNEFFGLWLTDDCTNYKLAESEGTPVTTNQPVSAHTLQYEDWLGMTPARLDTAHLREVVLFDDWGQNKNKRMRFRAVSDKLLSHVKVEPHPGVFILRRNSGKSRIMRNEMEMAEYLRARRGFRILDVTVDDVPTIVATCAGAKVIAGVEGSHLVHGIMALQPGGAVLTLQPPNRFCGVIKRTTDPDNQHFGFVVGQAEDGGFRIDAGEVERTLDLFPALP